MYVSKGTTIRKLLEELKEHTQVQLNMAHHPDSNYAEKLVKDLKRTNKEYSSNPFHVHCVVMNLEGYTYPSFIFSIFLPNTNRKAKFLLSDILE